LLQEQTTHDSFVSHGCHNIFNIVIGRPEHPSRVHVAGTGVAISQYFGEASHASNNSSAMISPEQLANIYCYIKE